MNINFPYDYINSLHNNDAERIYKINKKSLETFDNGCPPTFIPANNVDPNLQGITDNNGQFFITAMGGNTVQTPELVGWPAIINTPNIGGSPLTGTIATHVTYGNIPGGGKKPGNAGQVPDAISFSNLSGVIPLGLASTHMYTYCVKPQPITPISDVETTKVLTNGFTLKWKGCVNCTTYKYTLNDKDIVPSTDTGVANRTAIFTGLTPGTTYSVVVTGKNINSGPTNGSVSVTLPIPPTIPANFVFSNQSINGFTVSWTGGTGATSYTYSLNGTLTPASKDNGVESNSATFTELIPGQTYIIVITAINVNGSTPGNTTITLPLPPTTKPVTYESTNQQTTNSSSSTTASQSTMTTIINSISSFFSNIFSR